MLMGVGEAPRSPEGVGWGQVSQRAQKAWAQGRRVGHMDLLRIPWLLLGKGEHLEGSDSKSSGERSGTARAPI